MAKTIKDWTKSIEGLGEMDLDGVTNLYTEMLATAHDIGYKVPDAQLIETEDPEQLKAVIPSLHEGILKFHAAQTASAEKSAKTKKTAPAKADAKTTKKTVAKKPARKAEQKDVSKETEMATATAKKAPAKKAAKKAAPAKKAAKKAASNNARTGAKRFEGTEKISVKFKEIPGRADSEVGKRLANLQKFDGKTVDAFLKSSLGRTSTLYKSIAKGWITVK